ncbi:hypothetical protein K7432_012083 [Basidiobolus ranarum]|uniref:Cyclin N-terminal domain-containing protein n=1 Tax=Basidiobolus ranarum TaxID=34480 RepID=A0ABR2VT86_9FUNG
MSNPRISIPATQSYLASFTQNNISVISEFVTDLVVQMWYKHSDIQTGSPNFYPFCQKVIARSEVEPPTILLALKYIQRLKKYHPRITGEQGSECRLFVISLILAHKLLEDYTYTNQTWSQIARIPLEEINHMEREFLISIQFNLHVSEEEYAQWLLYLEQYLRYKEDPFLDSPRRLPSPTSAPAAFDFPTSKPTWSQFVCTTDPSPFGSGQTQISESFQNV